MKLSIIIPIYNVAPYLRKCVESALNQDLPAEEYELILVDDGSTDGSGAIADSLTPGPSPEGEGSARERKRPKIRVIHQANAGLSAARNAGIAVAQGEYIQFLDSDDYLESNVLGGLVEQMEREELDVLRFDYQNVRLKGGTYSVFEPYKTPRQVDRCTEIVDGETYLNTRMGYGCYAWQFILRRELLDGCVFTPGIYFEDVDWTPRMLLRARRVNATTKIVYNYLMREGSITKAIDVKKMRKKVDDKFVVIDTLNALIEKRPKCRWLYNMRSSMAEGILSAVATDFYNERKSYLKQLRLRRVFPLSLHRPTMTYYKRARLINASPRLYCLLVHLKYERFKLC